MSLIRAVGYLIVTGPVDQWRSFATDVLGAQIVTSSTDQELRLRTDERVYRIIVKDGPPAGPKSLVALGFETANAGALAELEEVLRGHGIEVTDDRDLAADRQVRRLLTFHDADGNTIEAYFGHATDRDAFASPRAATFVTGDLGVGHTFLLAADQQSNIDFYTGVLGFKVSDTIDFGGNLGTFMHCNPRHHSVALANFPGAPSGIGHLMLEVERFDSVGRALDVVQAQEIPLIMSMGEHTNDKMKSFYVRTPSGFEIEYGWDGLLIDDDEWTVGHYDAASTWGHHFLHPPPGPPEPTDGNELAAAKADINA